MHAISCAVDRIGPTLIELEDEALGPVSSDILSLLATLDRAMTVRRHALALGSSNESPLPEPEGEIRGTLHRADTFG